MDSTLARNIAILIGIAALVAFAPGAGFTAAVVNSVIYAAFLAVMVFVAAMFYRRYQYELFSVGDSYRALLYGATGLFVVLMAASSQLRDSSLGTAVLFAGLASVAGAIWVFVQRVRAYR
jgi:hypothetical protein